MSYNVSIKVSPTEYKHFEVPKEVYVYIKQLEAKINYPLESKLLEQYSGRFK